MEPVKRRRYDASRRRDQARRTREAIIAAARRRFLDDGYSATTIASIAADAASSADTIYKSFGGKAGLLRAVCEDALGGSGAVPAEERSDAMQAAESDPRRMLRGLGTLTAEVAPRIAPLLLLLVTAAEADPALRALRADLETERLARMTDGRAQRGGEGDAAAGGVAAGSSRHYVGVQLAGALPPARRRPRLVSRTVRRVRR